MPKIAVITDTDSSLPPWVAGAFGIRQVPITVQFDSETYTACVDIDDRQLFEKIDQRNKLPTTAAPSPSAFAAAYESAFQEGAESVVCVCVSSKVSGTYSSAQTAAGLCPGRDITVIDSLTLSMGQGFMALAAAEAAQAGANKDEVIARVLETRQNLHLYAVLSTLKYLALSGRVGKFVAGMADTLNIKPVLTIQDGALVLLERVRTRKKAEERMFALTAQALDGKGIRRAAVIHVNNVEGAQAVAEELRSRFTCKSSVYIAEFTPGLSVHAGSGVVGVVIETGR